MKTTILKMLGLSMLFLAMMGCGRGVKGNIGNVASYRVPSIEAEWIRNGEPIEYED